jgi:hypothetical protein
MKEPTMTERSTSADVRDELAADRDDAADRRDDAADDRDTVADQRDTEAVERDATARQDSHDLADHFRRLGEQILARLARAENATIDPADWPDLTPAALADLERHAAEQRRLAAVDRVAVTSLLDELQEELGHVRHNRRAAADDRHASAQDRQHSAGDRNDSEQDRDLAARDRGQAAIEREQVDPRAFPSDGDLDRHRPPEDHPDVSSTWAIAASQQRIAASRNLLDETRHHSAPAEGCPEQDD